MQKWRVIKNKTTNGAMNMAIDEAIMTSYKEGKCKPTLRFYTWKPSCLSIGYFQNLQKEVDLDKCRELNIDVVRRPTGGRAVLHQNELTYSIILGEDNSLMDKSINESYKFISKGIAKGLEIAGINIDKLKKGERISREKLSAACFNAHASYEITINNKKIVGSAQNRKDGVILQHGSIILNFNVDDLYEVIKTKNKDIKERAKKFTLSKASGIENEINMKVDILNLEESILSGIKKSFDVDFEELGLSDYELNLARDLYKKYSSYDYINKR
ncbi:lipoate--protein ligase family protein [Paraclostridium sordellii]|uniref:lipoate--protein ligase family protein n=1 Tax=Paraclostridium sordellii TaxID=1505 RepID=UPI0022E691C0|nr:biotin/lipoate A/B protein ligase family protein [Paeniclostridium sordellii]